MSFAISWEIEGEKQLSRVLIGMESNMKDYTVPFRQSATYLTGIFSRDVFETQGAAIGERWERLSPYTVAQKARSGFPATPLIATGRMRNSFKSIVSTDQAVIYNTADYFKYHQSRQPRTHLPRRVMMKLSENLKEQVVRYFQEHIRLSMVSP
ncbi:MAG: phage virion morphogenesis protein [Planctomycetota bacterium]